MAGKRAQPWPPAQADSFPEMDFPKSLTDAMQNLARPGSHLQNIAAPGLPQGTTSTARPWNSPQAESSGGILPVLTPLERRFIPDSFVRQMKNSVTTLIQNLSNNAFTPMQLDSIAEQIYRNIQFGEARSLGTINPNQRPLSVNSKQYSVIRGQLDKLTPDLRGFALQQFEQAVRSGALRCSDCGF
jgi:hypothetical protein